MRKLESEFLLKEIAKQGKPKKYIEDIRLFVCELGEQETLPEVKDGDLIDAPFQKFCIEASDADTLVTIKTLEGYFHIFSVICEEISPNKFNFWCSFTFEHENLTGQSKLGKKVHYLKHTDTEESFKLVYTNCYEIVFHTLKRMKRSKQGKEKRKIVIRGKNGTFSRINYLIHIASKDTYKNVKSTSSEPIDWSHRWEVRGHWRKCRTIGKDREGKYGVKGYTWVAAHTKGPEEAPLIKKTRIIHG